MQRADTVVSALLLSIPVSRILSSGETGCPVIYLSCLPSGLSLPIIRRSHLFRLSRPEYTWHFNPQGLSMPLVTRRHRGLYPRFHPYQIFADRAVLLSDTICHTTFVVCPPVRWCGALRCPDFPPVISLRATGRYAATNVGFFCNFGIKLWKVSTTSG